MLFHENVLLNDDDKVTHYSCDKNRQEVVIYKHSNYDE